MMDVNYRLSEHSPEEPVVSSSYVARKRNGATVLSE